MKNQKEVQVIGMLDVQRRIIAVRGVQVMLDRDLAALYGVETRVLNQAVRRNIGRFPEDFMFQLSKEDCLRSQIVTLNEARGKHLKYMPYAFTENGIAMLSSVLRSETAIEVNIRIMRAFTAMRCFVSDLSVAYSDDFHDRFLIIDNAELHGLGSSINRLGRRITSYTTRDPKEIAKLLATIRKI